VIFGHGLVKKVILRILKCVHLAVVEGGGSQDCVKFGEC